MNYHDSAKQIVATAVNIPPSSLPDDADIQTLAAWDSVAHINIILALEEVLGQQMEPENIIRVTGIESIAAILENPDRL